MNSNEVRRQFLEFFRSKKHAIVESSPVVPYDDPTLLFTNAGMNQFKDVFLGSGSRPFRRAANSQKCIRAGGKHNDLDDVGQDTYHHTFFEMLGNWSFGDYFKKEAIEWAWELLTQVWGIDRSRLHATYFEGDVAEGLEPDTEAAELWRTVTDIDPSHVHPGSKKDNFWEMGETGPCGPCSEIHVDLTPDKSGRSLVNAGDARVIELWNLVFIQFNRGAKAKLTPLPAKHVDTGMGFERLCAVLQGQKQGRLGQVSNYDTDVFTPIFEAIRKRTGAPAYHGTLPGKGDVRSDQSTMGHQQSTILVDVSYRVIADHLRCLVFALTDGAIPSNEGRGYVLRRILRRAVRYGRQYLDMHEPFLCDLVQPLVDHMAGAFPELSTAHNGRNVEHVRELVRDEEASFLKTLDRGLKEFGRKYADAVGYPYAILLGKDWMYTGPGAFSDWESEDETLLFLNAVRKLSFLNRQTNENRVVITAKAREEVESQGKRVCISGNDAFHLYDTQGFPIDLTELMAKELGIAVDIGEYQRLMEEARERSRGGSTEGWLQYVMPELIDDMPDLSGLYRRESFDPYSSLERKTRVHSVGRADQKRTKYTTSERLVEGDFGFVVLDSSPFYVEAGGQVGDPGKITTDFGVFSVQHVLRCPVPNVGDVIVHYGRVATGEIRKDYPCVARVDADYRVPTMKNHTATHILNWALREVLELHGGGKVDQKGSLVDPDKTRFDFSHGKPLTEVELDRIEELCNEKIAAALPVYAAIREKDYIDQKKARAINTLRAVFGEKYPDKVRVVSIGAPITEDDARRAGVSDWLLKSPDDPRWMQYSVEFCGGTHVKNTSAIEHFALTHEEGVAKGVRRMVGISGDIAKQAIETGNALLHEARSLAQPKERAAQETLPARLADFQRRLAEAHISLRARRQIQSIVADLQQVAREQQKQTAAESGEAVTEAVRKLLESAETVSGVTVVVGQVPPASADALRGAIDWVRNKTQASAVLLATVSEGKVTLVAGMSKAALDKGLHAGHLIKEIAPLVGGKGGGRPDMAQGGGADEPGLQRAMNRASQWLLKQLGTAPPVAGK